MSIFLKLNREKSYILFSDFIKKIFNKLGLKLLSKNVYANILVQRDTAVKNLVNLRKNSLVEGVEGIIFSRDRAIQLNSLLESYFHFVKSPAKLNILYTVSNKAHLDSYLELQEKIRIKTNLVTFIQEEKDFKSSLVKCLSEINVRRIFFLVDDIIFLREMDFDVLRCIDSNNSILSLRLSPKLKRSYTSSKNHKLPKFSRVPGQFDLIEFEWFETGLEWSNPWSVDGHIFSLAEIWILAQLSDYKGPNSFEGSLNLFDSLCQEKKGFCFENSIILNIPANRVQIETTNISGEISPEYLLSKWNEGYCIDFQRFINYIPESTHEEHFLEFKKRE